MTDKTKKTNTLSKDIEEEFTKWIKDKPTGKFSVDVNVNQGGIRDREVTIKYKF